MKAIFILVLFISLASHSQSLEPERVAKIKATTARVTIEGSDAMGSAFVIKPNGLMLTCYHVIAPAFNYNEAGHITGAKNIFVTFANGEIYPVRINHDFFKKMQVDLFLYDYCFIEIIAPANKKFSFLKTGKYDAAKEGDEVYTCGYPVGIEQQFISRGMISTKYIDTIKASNGTTDLMKPRKQTLMDLTLNRGNSGGAIVRKGKSIEEDEVIGIADFIVTPIGGLADQLIEIFSKATGTTKIGGVDPNASFALLTRFIASTSIGVSGAVSIEYPLAGLDAMYKSTGGR